MLNYEVDPAVLRPFVPRGTELDAWSNRTFITVVGFLFANTRIFGVPVPFHRTFEEVNLRFYVRRVVSGETRRAVTFIKELVPRAMVARIARLAYNEPYDVVTMRHRYEPVEAGELPSLIEYSWRAGETWSALRARPVGVGREAAAGSEEEFITEHYWGYTRQRDGSTIEYRVTHPRWRVWSVDGAEISGDLGAVYGATFAAVLGTRPSSAFVADGSHVAVGWPARLVATA